MSSHTQGPWVAEPWGRSGYSYIRVEGADTDHGHGDGHYGRAIARTTSSKGGQGYPTQERANAHLIAAAPLMLEALQAIEVEATDGTVLELARAALLAAKGVRDG